jgi:hypothetical protein
MIPSPHRPSTLRQQLGPGVPLEQRENALTAVAYACRNSGRTSWSAEDAKSVLVSVVSIVESRETALKERALRAVREILLAFDVVVQDMLSLLLDAMFSLHAEASRDILRAGEECLHILAERAEPQLLLDLLQPILLADNVPKVKMLCCEQVLMSLSREQILMAIKLETRIIQRIPAEQLNAVMPWLGGALIQVRTRRDCISV